MKKRNLTLLLCVIFTIALITVQVIFTLPDSAKVTTISESSSAPIPELACYRNASPKPLDVDGKINLLVWNIYKQNRENWQQVLGQYSQGRQLVLLQEANMTPDLKAWIATKMWNGNQVEAFKAFDSTAGVLNLAPELPKLACAYTELEPWLRLPKSGLYATYALSNGASLAVVNIHAVNFTFGTQEYQHQLSVLINELKHHQGPIIVAGDFNSWSESRVAVMSQVLGSIGVKEVHFSPDHRVQFVTGLALDHVFVRGLKVDKAEAPQTDASDHNPLLVELSLP